MLWRVLVAFSLVVATALEHGRPVPNVTINLDIDPQERWIAMATRFRASIRAAASIFEDQPHYRGLVQAVQGMLLQRGSAAQTLSLWFPGEQLAELESISAVTRVKLPILVVINMFYDLINFLNIFSPMACTSIITENTDGEIVHGRNLDWTRDVLPAMASNTVQITFEKGGRELFSAVSIAGMVSFNTVVKPGLFAISHDQRYEKCLTSRMSIDTISTFSLVRRVAEDAGSFLEAVHMLRDTPLSATSYFSVSGVTPGEGVVITRDCASAVDFYPLDVPSGRWYLLEANYDRLKSPARGDNRRCPAQRFLNATGRAGFSGAESQAALANTEHNAARGEKPTRNSGTLYSAVMRARRPALLHVTLWVPPAMGGVAGMREVASEEGGALVVV